jgi:hypothetical protein
MTPTITKPLELRCQEFIRASEQLLSEDFETEDLTDEELAILRMHIDMLGQKFFL